MASMREFIKDNRDEIDTFIRNAMQNNDYRINDTERREWIANAEPLYWWAKGEGVNV